MSLFLRAATISAAPTLPYRWPSSVALASIVMLCLADLGGLLAQLGLPGQLDLLQLHLVLVDHPLVMVVASVARPCGMR